MNFSKWNNLIKVFLIRLIDEIENRLNGRHGETESNSFKSSLYASVKILLLGQIDKLTDEVTNYARNQVNSLATVVAQKLSVVLSSLIYVLILVGLSIIGFMFIAISLSLYLGEILGKTYYGFLAMGILVIIITIMIGKWSQKTISEKIKDFITKQL